jgi:hypothetical protein
MLSTGQEVLLSCSEEEASGEVVIVVFGLGDVAIEETLGHTLLLMLLLLLLLLLFTL